MSQTSLPSFVEWSSFPFEGNFRVKTPDEPVAVEPPRTGENASDCPKCHASDDAYIWVNENWRVRSMDRPSGLPMVLILESRSHLDLGDLPNMLAAELGVMTVRLERAIRSIDGVARVHVNRWGDGAAHLHLWFMGRPYGRLQLRGTFLTLWDEILPAIPEHQWRENLALVAAWLAEFGGEPLAKPPSIDWKAPASFAPNTAAAPPPSGGVAQADADQAPTDSHAGAGLGDWGTGVDWADGTDSGATDLGRDPSGTDPSGTDPSGTDPSGTDPSGTDPADRAGSAGREAGAQAPA